MDSGLDLGVGVLTEALARGTFAVRAIVFCFGACLGSFIHVVAHRVPRGISIVHPPSSCPACGKRLACFENFPVLGWVILRGRCRGCGASISPSYVLAELLMGFAVLGIFMHHVEVNGDLAGFAASTAFFSWLLMLSISDLKERLLPDALIAPVFTAVAVASFGSLPDATALANPYALAVNLVFAAFLSWMAVQGLLGLVWLAGGSAPAENMEDWLARMRILRKESFDLGRGAWILLWVVASCLMLFSGRDLADRQWLGHACSFLLAGSLPYLSGRLVTVAVKEEAIGMGDVKFAACLGFLFMPFDALLFLAIATILGAFAGIVLHFSSKSSKIPFGPFLALGAFACYEGGEAIDYLLRGFFGPGGLIQ